MIIYLPDKSKLTISFEKRDPLFESATKIISNYDVIGTSHIQKELKVGYARADRILSQLCEAGYVSLPPTGLRKVFKK